MIITQSVDYELIRQIMTEPQIWQEICGIYGGIIEEFHPIVDGYIYLIGYDKLDIIGLFIIHPQDSDFMCHVQVLPEKRKEYSFEFGKEVIQWTWDNTDINKLIALIPEKFKNVISFAESQGFQVTETKDSDVMMKIER